MMHENCFYLTVFIVEREKGSMVLKHAKQNGALGGSILLGRGTVNSTLLHLLELADNRKAVVWILAGAQSAINILSKTADKFDFDKANKGIAFSVPISNLFGTKNSIGVGTHCHIQEEDLMTSHQAIIAIIEKGQAERVVEAARRAGAYGATIINARGSGIHEEYKLFAIEIEPEKEIVLMVVKSEQVDKICKQIIKETQINEPGKGVLFTQPINHTYGLEENKSQKK
jgi:nitrogen regulatory protein PII